MTYNVTVISDCARKMLHTLFFEQLARDEVCFL